ncbi:MAG: hypothetical protein ABR505_01820 [Actinomycetota bacterium]
MERASGDYFARARVVAAIGLIAAAGLAVAGAFLDWASIGRLPATIPPAQSDRAEPLRGVDIPGGWLGLADGWWAILAAAILVVAGVLLIRTARSSYGWLAFGVAVVLGGIVIADFRSISRPTSDLTRRLDRIGEVDPGLGLVLAAVAAGIALIAALIGVAAAPKAPVD